MIRGKCPTCSRAFAITSLVELPTFPFCSERCRLVDLGRWLDGRHAIPSSQTEGDDEEEAESPQQVPENPEEG